MSAKLTIMEREQIKDIMIVAMTHLFDLLDDIVDKAYQDGYKDGETETEERLRVKE